MPIAPSTPQVSLAIVGGGPAGLMAAEAARAAGIEVDLYERLGSVGRKILLAGKGGLNLTHSEPFDAFVTRYGARAPIVGDWLRDFDADALRTWARGLGIDTMVGSSGRVFPSTLKAAPLLRGWVRRLRTQGVRFHVEHRCTGLTTRADGLQLSFDTPQGARTIAARAVVLALGGGSWPQLGTDGSWTQWLDAGAEAMAPLQPANAGFELDWSPHFATRFAGTPLKPVTLHWPGADGQARQRQGELIVTAEGLEGSLIYAAGADLREHINQHGHCPVELDLVPGRTREQLTTALSRPRGKRSLSEHLRRSAGLQGVQLGLLHETLPAEHRDSPDRLAATLKRLPLRLLRIRPLAEAISTAGGLRLEALDAQLMLRTQPGVFAAGEMLDWEAPTGGYLLTACLAGGLRAGQAAAHYLAS